MKIMKLNWNDYQKAYYIKPQGIYVGKSRCSPSDEWEPVFISVEARCLMTQAMASRYIDGMRKALQLAQKIKNDSAERMADE